MSNHGHVNYGDEVMSGQAIGCDADVSGLVLGALHAAQEAAGNGAVINNGILNIGGSVVINDVTYVEGDLP